MSSRSSLWTRLVHVRRAASLIWTATGGWTIGWGALLLVQGALPAVLVYLTKVLIDRGADAVGAGLTEEAVMPVLIPVLLMGGVLVTMEIMQAVQGWIETAQSELLEDHVVSLVHEQAAAVDLAFYESPMYHDLMVQANGQAPERMLSLLEGMGSIIQNLVTLLGVALLLIPYSVWLPLVLFLSTLPAFWVVVAHRTAYHDWWRETTERRRWTDYLDYIITSSNSAPEVRLLDLAQKFRSAYVDARQALREERLALLKRQGVASFGAGLITLLVMAGAIGWMLTRVLRGTGTLGDLVLFYQAFSRSQDLARALLGSLGSLYGDSLFLEHLFAFLALDSTITDAPSAASETVLDEAPTVTFANVSFRYPGTESWALRDFSLTLPAEKTVALVGPNGAGKSTFVKLLCRLYDPEEGRILIDGVDLRNISLATLRRRTTALLQHPVHYAATASDNIRFGDLHVERPPEAIREAARAGDAHGFISTLPHGYDTLLGKEFAGGAELSGGQWQRLTLARAFYRDAPLVLLDEPTSFMDSWAELAWLDTFEALVEGCTALIVTHRFTTAMRADVIHVMEEGTIVESGSHADLLERNGAYARSWRAQMDAHEERERQNPSSFSS